MQDVDSGGPVDVEGAGSTWEISVLSVQFCCEPESALKIVHFFLKKKKQKNKIIK